MLGSSPSHSNVVIEGRPRRPWIAGAALVVGASALILTAVHQSAGPFEKPAPIEQVLGDKAKSLFERARAAMRGDNASVPARPPPPPSRNVDQYLRGAAAGLGALGVALALGGFARRENSRACGGALVLGIASLPWQVGLAVVVALAFVALAGTPLVRRR